jgi:glycine cleavage system H protein
MDQESYPDHLRYVKEHVWARAEDGEAVVGITWYAQDALGTVVYAELPAQGDSVSAGQPFGELESVKAVSDVYAPVTGTVVSVNESVDDEPELVNQDCYDRGWLIRVRLDDPGELETLMDAEAYRALLEQA